MIVTATEFKINILPQVKINCKKIHVLEDTKNSLIEKRNSLCYKETELKSAMTREILELKYEIGKLRGQNHSLNKNHPIKKVLNNVQQSFH